jgi:hypothetical protein
VKFNKQLNHGGDIIVNALENKKQMLYQLSTGHDCICSYHVYEADHPTELFARESMNIICLYLVTMSDS